MRHLISSHWPACLLALFATAAPAQANDASEAINLRRTVTVEVVERTKDAVVNISTRKIINRRVSPFGTDPFWQSDIGSEVVRVPANSLGSGFIIHSDGYVVTNNHVIDRARQITVELNDGRKLPADLLGSDPDADLAILKVSSDKPLPTLPLGDSSDLMIGEPVIAIGNPLGYSHTVSTGIVSAVHRDLKNASDQVTLGDLVQTDAAINPGNSGGPLLNAYGQVIGINTAIRGDAQNIGFSIPIDRLRDLIPELMNPAQANKAEIELKLVEKRTLIPPAQIECRIVTAEPRPRLVRSLNHQQPRNIVDAYAILLREHPGDSLALDCDGERSPRNLPVKPVPAPDAIVEAHKRLGVSLVQLTPSLAEKFRIDADDGLLIQEVARDSIAARAGLKPGDIVIQLGRYRVATLEDLASLLHRLPDHGNVRIGVVRDGQVGFGTLEL